MGSGDISCSEPRLESFHEGGGPQDSTTSRIEGRSGGLQCGSGTLHALIPGGKGVGLGIGLAVGGCWKGIGDGIVVVMLLAFN